MAAALGIQIGAPTFYVERLRLADGVPLLLEQVHLPVDRFPGLLSEDLERARSTTCWPGGTTRRWRPARETIVPTALPAREARLLGQQPDSLALLVEGMAYTRAGVPVEYARSYVRGDRMRYHVDREIARIERSRPGDSVTGSRRPVPVADRRRRTR